MSNETSKELDLIFLLKILKNAWWKILIFTVVIAVAVACVVQFVIPKKYSSTTEFYVLNTSTTSEYTTTTLLSAAEYLSKDYIEIINGDLMIEAILADIAEHGYVTYSPNTLRSMISSSTSSESSTFSITVTSTDKELAFFVCDSITKNAPEVIKAITRPSYSSNLYSKTTDENGNVEYKQINEADLECVKIIRSPELANGHVFPNVTLYTLIAAVVAALLAYVFFLIRKIIASNVKSEEKVNESVSGTVTENNVDQN